MINLIDQPFDPVSYAAHAAAQITRRALAGEALDLHGIATDLASALHVALEHIEQLTARVAKLEAQREP
jgi:hypothetical protein